jgi:hypothetical protein
VSIRLRTAGSLCDGNRVCTATCQVACGRNHPGSPSQTNPTALEGCKLVVRDTGHGLNRECNAYTRAKLVPLQPPLSLTLAITIYPGHPWLSRVQHLDRSWIHQDSPRNGRLRRATARLYSSWTLCYIEREYAQQRTQRSMPPTEFTPTTNCRQTQTKGPDVLHPG